MITLLVDSLQYIQSNCYQHQLYDEFCKLPIRVIELNQLSVTDISAGKVVSVLKLRTLFNNRDLIKKKLQGNALTIYEQDPWESFYVGSQYIDSYSIICDTINVEKFCVTTKWWADYVSSKGIPTQFVKIGFKESYISPGVEHSSRSTDLGFVGTLHPHRAAAFELLKTNNIHVKHVKGSSNYIEFLKVLQNIKVYVHNESKTLVLKDGTRTDLDIGLWIKDVESCSQGCYSIRNRAQGHETYLEGIKTFYMYDTVPELVDILAHISTRHPDDVSNDVLESLQVIRNNCSWSQTVNSLIS